MNDREQELTDGDIVIDPKIGRVASQTEKSEGFVYRVWTLVAPELEHAFAKMMDTSKGSDGLIFIFSFLE